MTAPLSAPLTNDDVFLQFHIRSPHHGLGIAGVEDELSRTIRVALFDIPPAPGGEAVIVRFTAIGRLTEDLDELLRCRATGMNRVESRRWHRPRSRSGICAGAANEKEEQCQGNWRAMVKRHALRLADIRLNAAVSS